MRVTVERRAIWSALLCGVLVLGGGCGKKVPPPPVVVAPPPAAPKPEAHLTVTASGDTNPDASGRPSPVVVRLYLLRSDASFNGTDFFGLFDDDEQALGGELIRRDELVLVPAEQRDIELPLAEETRFVGAIAAFRDIRNAQWRAIVPAWREGARVVTLSIERARVQATVTAPEDAPAGEK